MRFSIKRDSQNAHSLGTSLGYMAAVSLVDTAIMRVIIMHKYTAWIYLAKYGYMWPLLWIEICNPTIP